VYDLETLVRLHLSTESGIRLGVLRFKGTVAELRQFLSTYKEVEVA
jgi:hypothetical protein